MPTIPATVASRLAFAEHDFLHTSARLKDLATVLSICSSDVPCCALAGKRVRRLARHLERILLEIDDEITAAIRSISPDEPPF